MKQANKMVIYQVFPRWFGNMKSSLVKNGSKVENGVGKFSDFTPVALSKIKELGTTHIWYTGVIEHATNTDYTAYQIRRDHAAVCYPQQPDDREPPRHRDRQVQR